MDAATAVMQPPDHPATRRPAARTARAKAMAVMRRQGARRRGNHARWQRNRQDHQGLPWRLTLGIQMRPLTLDPAPDTVAAIVERVMSDV
jgi:hypothetical protein